jgi:glycosyltransferase involved in cell wall biosynthesis
MKLVRAFRMTGSMLWMSSREKIGDLNNGTVLLKPIGDALSDNPEVSIVVPALNEEITVGEFVDWCKEGLERAGVEGQVLIVDSSSDRTAAIALAHGAEVLKVGQRGLGRAYIDAIPFIRGRYVIMGDADLTYDFREITSFVSKFSEGYEFVMGSRFKGTIEEEAMPLLHQYFGTPLTTRILNVIYGSRFSDIHCGMRGITREGLVRMRLASQSWQYASEMIIKALHLGLRISEVPINFYKDREGRVSNFKRIGWFAPWQAGWLTLRAIFTFGADFFLLRPGAILAAVGLVGVVLLYGGPVAAFGIGLSLHWMLFFLLLFLVGLQFFFMGILARAIYDSEKRRSPKWLRLFGFGRSSLASAGIFWAGLLSMRPLVVEYVDNGFHLPPQIGRSSYEAVGGIGLVFAAVIYFTFSLLYNAVMAATPSTPQMPPVEPARVTERKRDVGVSRD